MQQVVEEGGEGYGDGASYIYDDMFPALPEATNPVAPTTLGGWGAALNNKMRVGSSDITQVGLHCQLLKSSTKSAYFYWKTVAKKRLLPTNYLTA